MSTNRYHEHQLIINYLYMKLNSRLPGLHIEDLKAFLDEKGWKIYDINLMVKDVAAWWPKHRLVSVH